MRTYKNTGGGGTYPTVPRRDAGNANLPMGAYFRRHNLYPLCPHSIAQTSRHHGRILPTPFLPVVIWSVKCQK